MKNIYYLIFLTLNTNFLFGQNLLFPTKGTIEYEKSINIYSLYRKSITDKNESSMRGIYDDYKKNHPQFKKLRSNLIFDKNKTLFVPIEDDNNDDGITGNKAMIKQHSTIFTDLNIGKFVSQKHVFDETFLVKDTLRKINWKITNETRDILGFVCRRANAVILDSIYVVAFYTSQIPVPGGPESFTGLPGMIMEVALPHEGITWLSTKFKENVNNEILVPPKKGKPIDSRELNRIMNIAKKDWGIYAQTLFTAFSL